MRSMTVHHDDTLAQLSIARMKLQDQLSKIEFEEKTHDSAINTIALIVRTLEKIDQLSRVLIKDKNESPDELSDDEFEKLKIKVKALIKKSISQESTGSEG